MRVGLPDLHRSGQVADWEAIPPSEWNEYQKRAAATNGWDTPGNRTSAEGALFTLAGLALINHDTAASSLVGTVLVGMGRVKDLQDGKDADRTGTKSPKGKLIDASLDAALVVVASAVLKRREIVPEEDANAMIDVTAQKGVANGVARLRGIDPEISRAGKYAMFGVWGGIGLRMVERTAYNFGKENLSDKVGNAANVVTRIGLGLSRRSTAGYMKAATAPKK